MALSLLVSGLLVWRDHIPAVVGVPIGTDGLPGRHHLRMAIVVLRRHEGTVVWVYHHHMTGVAWMVALIHLWVMVHAGYWRHMAVVVLHNGLCVMRRFLGLRSCPWTATLLLIRGTAVLLMDSHGFLGTSFTCLPCAFSSFRICTSVALRLLWPRLSMVICGGLLRVGCHIVGVRVVHGSHGWLVVWMVQMMHLGGIMGSILVRCVVVKRRMLVHEGRLMCRWSVKVGCHVDGLRIVLLSVVLGSCVLLIHRVHTGMAIVHGLIEVRMVLRRCRAAWIGATMGTVIVLWVAYVMRWALRRRSMIYLRGHHGLFDSCSISIGCFLLVMICLCLLVQRLFT